MNHDYSFDNIIGKSQKITDAIKMARLVAETQTTVLLTGETGTGKEVFAKAIHFGGDRSEAPFVAINCSSFTRDLLESELFGYKAGAFTGAAHDKKGIIEAADEGTLFLDEIGEMPLELQAKLLRVLEAREFIKLGDTESVSIDVRGSLPLRTAICSKRLKAEHSEATSITGSPFSRSIYPR